MTGLEKGDLLIQVTA